MGFDGNQIKLVMKLVIIKPELEIKLVELVFLPKIYFINFTKELLLL